MGIDQESPYVKKTDLMMVTGPDEYERMHQATRFIIETKSCSVVELKIHRVCDGELRIIRWQAEPEFDSNGNLVKIIGVMVDITAEKLREADIVYL
ncbi:PAS domain-containing protein, partial [Christiangramia aquimixticola]|uniref:PAS domain-containing protein n=1 Tax=Christiangramia aquimixticola TaxID=1697558 RepID=UPI003AA934F0